jgi:phospholipid-binding lipoprotein MlaA
MNPNRVLSALCIGVLAAALGGCATTQAPSRSDPFEPFNRAMYAIHEPIDRDIVRPVIQAYADHVPRPIREPIASFFAWIEDFFSGVNGMLQGKPEKAGHDFGRVLVNSFTLGLVDIASQAGIPRGEEDFGQTFGHWGAPPGPYLFIPLFGPSSVRDLTGVGVRIWLAPLRQIPRWAVRDAIFVLDYVNLRSQALEAQAAIEKAALDPYTFIRRSYLQRRDYLIYDGAPPRKDDDE